MQLLTFALGGIKFGVKIHYVKFIELAVGVTKIPHTFSYIKGIANLHDTVIPIYSLADKMHYLESKTNNIIVAEVDGIQMGFEVEEVREILDIPESQIIPMPDLISHDQTYLTDVANSKEELVVLLDLQQIVHQERESIQQILAEEDSNSEKQA